MSFSNTCCFLSKISTSGHSPLKFLGDDLCVYYLKSPVTANLKIPEMHPLFSEVICHKLLKRLKINTPDISLMCISPDSFNERHLFVKRTEIKEIYLAIKKIEFSDLIHTLSISKFVPDSLYFDIFRQLTMITIFDLWVNNCDRGRSGNYNLLVQYKQDSFSLFAFDHSACFGGLQLYLEGNLPLFQHNMRNRLLNSMLFYNIAKKTMSNSIDSIIENFFSLRNDDISAIVSDAYEFCPDEWNVNPHLKESVEAFLTDKKRQDNIVDVIKDSVKNL